jgi:opacity protein-like surface antigen
MKKFLCVLSFMVMVCAASLAQAEWYAGAQLGGNISTNLSGITATGFGSSVSIPDQTPKGGLVYGAKLGYYTSPLYKNLGIGLEAEVFQSSMSTSYTSPSLNVDTNLNVTTLAPLSFMVRYQLGNIEPYAGVGPAILFSNLSASASVPGGSGTASASSVDLGFITKAGVRYKVTQHIAAFAEWKYTQASMGFSAPGVGTISGDYSSQMAVVGVGYHF